MKNIVIYCRENPEKLKIFLEKISKYDISKKINICVMTDNDDNVMSQHYNKIRLKYKNKMPVNFIITLNSDSFENKYKSCISQKILSEENSVLLKDFSSKDIDEIFLNSLYESS